MGKKLSMGYSRNTVTLLRQVAVEWHRINCVPEDPEYLPCSECPLQHFENEINDEDINLCGILETIYNRVIKR